MHKLLGLSFLTIEDTMFSLRYERYHNLGFVLLVFCIAGATAGLPSQIIGGSDAVPGEFPWQVSIRLYDVHVCGGSIISNRHILTAGHCVVGHMNPPYSEVTVVTGSNSLKPGTGKAFRVDNVTVHDQYRPRTAYTMTQFDAAVISLRKEIEENEYQKAIPLPSEEVPNGVEGTASGFGRIAPDEKLTTVLQKLNVVIMGNSQCMDNGVRLQKFQLCANKVSGHGTCKGDSGGPLVYNGAVVGIASMSPRTCGNGVPDIYTRVFYVKDFIETAMATI